MTLASRAGYFGQKIDDMGRQIELPEMWDPSDRLQLPMPKWPCRSSAVPYGWAPGSIARDWAGLPVLLLDTDLPENNIEDREITHYLYGKDAAYRLKQEIVLGVGGVRMLQALGSSQEHHHLNEGHSALLAMELLNRYEYQGRSCGRGNQALRYSRVRANAYYHAHSSRGRTGSIRLWDGGSRARSGGR